MLFIVFQLLLLFVFVFLLGSLLTRNKIARQLLFVLGVLFITFQISSVLLGNALIDYKYYIHWNVGIVKSTAGFFAKEGFKLAAYFIGILALMNVIARFFSTTVRNHKLVTIFLMLLSVGGMCVNNGILSNINEIRKLHFAKKKKFTEALTQLNMTDYVSKEDVKASAGKNIIVIALESVEASFLKDNMAHLTPNMRRLSKEMNYYNMKPAAGSSYTIGAIYTYLTGFPHFYKNHGNDVFGTSMDIKVTSISNALSKAGYNQLYLLGNPDFAGTRKMLNLMDIDIKSEEDYDPKYKLNYWGLHDKDLFDLAQKEIKELKAKGAPFAFYMSTISTHHPNGVLDQRMVEQFPEQKSELELMVRAVDQHINDLVDFLKKENLLEETSIYILPDHLLMGQGPRVLNDFIETRDLFLITNGASKSYPTDKSILQIDIPRIILEGAGVETNMTFMADAIKGDKLNFINGHKHKIIQLNEAALSTSNEVVLKEKKKAKPKGFVKHKDVVYVKSKSRSKKDSIVSSPIYIGMEELKAEEGFNLLVYDEGKYQHEVFNTVKSVEEVDRLLNRLTTLVEEQAYFVLMVHSSAGNKLSERKEGFKAIGFNDLAELTSHEAYVALSNIGFVSEAVRARTIETQTWLNPRKTVRTEAEIFSEAKDPMRIIAHAGGLYKGKKYTNCLEAMNLSYKKGFKLFELDIIKTMDGQFVAAHDWKQWAKKSGYKGKTPPDKKTFLSMPIGDGFTPMDMTLINDWFAKHPDAILITDKVNDPEAFIPQFIDPSRLMMELFSFDAAKKAQELGVKEVILSESVLNSPHWNKVEELKKRKINYMAVSRKTIDRHRHIYKKLKAAGIKVFAYHINFDPLKDEAYMFREGLDFCYGLYADDWEIEVQ